MQKREPSDPLEPSYRGLRRPVRLTGLSPGGLTSLRLQAGERRSDKSGIGFNRLAFASPESVRGLRLND
jgi:hypothetical protein